MLRSEPTPPQRERRVFAMNELRVAPGADGAKSIKGHAAVFNRDSTEMYGFTERVAPGAFTRAIQEDDVRGLFNHNPDYVLGRKASKTLRLAEDVVGLGFEIDLPDTQCARDLAVSIERRDITGCSFSFTTRADQWVYNDDGTAMRTLLDLRLYDVGPVTFPAYPDTDVAVRSMMEAIATEGLRRAAAAKKGVPLAIRKRQVALLAQL